MSKFFAWLSRVFIEPSRWEPVDNDEAVFTNHGVKIGRKYLQIDQYGNVRLR